MKKLLTMVATACALLATGCQAAAPTATLHTQPAAAKRQLMAIDGEAPRSLVSWNITFTETDQVRNRNGKLPDALGTGQAGGIIRDAYMNGYRSYIHNPDVVFNGEGELLFNGDRRFSYRVPPGRLLVLSRAVRGLLIDRMPVGNHDTVNRNWNGADGIALDLVYGPGELVVFEMNEYSSIQGYTGDPAMRGLPSGGGAAAAEAGK